MPGRFSQAKKCSNEGRALMQLDYQQFRTKMEKMTLRRHANQCHLMCIILTIIIYRPLPHHDIVENYIRAYYMSETDLESWLTNNYVCMLIYCHCSTDRLYHMQVYSAKQLQGIVQCGAGGHLNKKTKQRLMSVIANDDSNR